jgi:hypothetical protein
MECAYYFASLNGLAFNGKPQATAMFVQELTVRIRVEKNR